MSAALQPVTFYVPETTSEPIEIEVKHSGLRLVLVSRESIGLLSDHWAVLGIYILLGPSKDDPDRYKAYVGEVGKRTLQQRVREHAREKDFWSRALLIASRSDEFDSAEIGWLEGRIYDVLNNAVAADVTNTGKPGDTSMDRRDRAVLERYVQPIMAALRACGASPDTADQKPLPPKRKKPASYDATVKDLLGAGILKSGTQLRPMRPSLTGSAVVQENGDLVIAGRSHTSPSAAAAALSGNVSEPGWDFWGAPSGDGGFVALAALRERYLAGQTAQLAGDAPATSPAEPGPVPESLVVTAPASQTKTRYFSRTSTRDLLAVGLLVAGETLTPHRPSVATKGQLLEDGRIRVGDQIYGSLSAAGVAAAHSKAEPGWEFWTVGRNGQPVTLFALRAKYERQQDG